MKIEEYLKDLIISKYGSVHRFAGVVEMPPSTIYSILKNVGGASINHIFRMTVPLGITVDELVACGEKENKDDPKARFTGQEIDDILESIERYDYIPYTSYLTPKVLENMREFRQLAVPNSLLGRHAGDKELLFMHVTGDSMDKVLPDGCIVAVKRGVALHELKDKDVVALFVDNQLYIKAFFFDEKNNRLIFKPVSHNPLHIGLTLDIKESSTIFGRVIAFNVII